MHFEVRGETAADIGAIEALTIAAFLHAPHTSHSEQYIVNALRTAGSLKPLSRCAGRGLADRTCGGVPSIDIGWRVRMVRARALVGDAGTPRSGHGLGLDARSAAPPSRVWRGGMCAAGEPKFYQRFGFNANPGLVLPAVPPEYFLAIAFGRDSPQGIVSYHDAFNASA